MEEINDDLQQLIDDMAETMYNEPGVGLAATQVGRDVRVIVYDISGDLDKGQYEVLINPEIVLREGQVTYEEACLSVVDFSAEVTRNAHVKVQGVDLKGKPVDVEAEGLLAICLQHEIDHLNGVLYIDHISNLKRTFYKKKLKKKLKNP